MEQFFVNTMNIQHLGFQKCGLLFSVQMSVCFCVGHLISFDLYIYCGPFQLEYQFEKCFKKTQQVREQREERKNSVINLFLALQKNI